MFTPWYSRFLRACQTKLAASARKWNREDCKETSAKLRKKKDPACNFSDVRKRKEMAYAEGEDGLIIYTGPSNWRECDNKRCDVYECARWYDASLRGGFMWLLPLCSRCKRKIRGRTGCRNSRYENEYNFSLHLQIKIYNCNWNKVTNLSRTLYVLIIRDLRKHIHLIENISITFKENFTALIYRISEIKFSFCRWEFGLIWLYEPRDFTARDIVAAHQSFPRTCGTYVPICPKQRATFDRAREYCDDIARVPGILWSCVTSLAYVCVFYKNIPRDFSSGTLLLRCGPS